MFTDNIETINMDGISDFERIDSELRALIVTVIGTLPGSRAFGIEDFTDENMNDAESDFAAALDDGCEQFIPEITIESVTFDVGTDGKMITRIYVEERDGD